MKYCTNCGHELPDDACTCDACGAPVGSNADYYQAAPVTDSTDHTDEFDPKDISDNKVVAMVIYLVPFFGILIALLSQSTSKYAAFHLRQALKLMVVDALVGIITAFLFWTIIIPILGGICLCITTVLRFIAFFQICKGKAKELPIISTLGFLK